MVYLESNMNLEKITDQSLHQQLKDFVRQERVLVSKVLEHLCEVERRRLYGDFKRTSLFDYAVKELGYSEDQAHRRIQAMRLIKELPEVKEKLNSGALSLTNAAKAQGLFRRSQQSSKVATLNKETKLAVLESIEHKSTRDAERELLKFQPRDVTPVDRLKAVSPNQTELRVVLDQKTVEKLDEVRALLGAKGIELSHDQLLLVMAEATIATLKEKRFGKQRARQTQASQTTSPSSSTESLGANQVVEQSSTKHQRYVPAAVKHAVWQRDQGQCCQCGSRKNLQYDHIKPFGIGGTNGIENLRLLCFSCNQRAAMRVYGVEAMRVAGEKSWRHARKISEV
jgi:5-methylcytosine-specific restriction endonuclease McrA